MEISISKNCADICKALFISINFYQRLKKMHAFSINLILKKLIYFLFSNFPTVLHERLYFIFDQSTLNFIKFLIINIIFPLANITHHFQTSDI